MLISFMGQPDIAMGGNTLGSYSHGAEIRNTFGSEGAPNFGPFPGPASGDLLMLEVRRCPKSPFVPYLRFLMARRRLYAGRKFIESAENDSGGRRGRDSGPNN